MTQEAPLRLQVIIASTRPGRVGAPVARWFDTHAQAHAGFTTEVVDLAAWDLPMFNEPHHPRLGTYEHELTRRWSEQIQGADAFVMVMPEYNYGFNAALKNAIDYLHHEWRDKPVGFVSYGGVAAGTRAVQMLKQVLTTLRMVTVFEAVNIPFVHAMIGDDGELVANEIMDKAAVAMLDELVRVGRALAPLRAG